MSTEIYTEKLRLRSADVDFAGRWRMDQIFLAMQELGEAHSTLLGAGYGALRPRGLAWILNRAEIRLDACPLRGEEIEMRTWPGRPRHGIYPRFYAFFGAEEKLLGSAGTLWALIDLNERAIVQGAARGVEIEPPAQPPLAVRLPGALEKSEGARDARPRQALYEDLDLNGHVNNARYIAWLQDALPLAAFESAYLSRVLIHFMSEIRPGEEIETCLAGGPDSWFFSGAGGGRLRFALNAEMNSAEG